MLPQEQHEYINCCTCDTIFHQNHSTQLNTYTGSFYKSELRTPRVSSHYLPYVDLK